MYSAPTVLYTNTCTGFCSEYLPRARLSSASLTERGSLVKSVGGFISAISSIVGRGRVAIHCVYLANSLR